MVKIIKKEMINLKTNLAAQRNMINIITVLINKIKILTKEMEWQHFTTQNMMNLERANPKRIKMKLDTMIIIIKVISEAEEEIIIVITTTNTVTQMNSKIKEDNESW